MKIKSYLLVFVIMVLAFQSCRKDDGIEKGEPERDRAEQQHVDDSLLVDYFGKHYYNSGDFNPPNDPDATINNLVITELLEGESVPADHTLLSEVVETHTTTFAEVEYKYYILRLNQGGGAEKPNFPDEIRVNFTGFKLDGDEFDSSVNPIELDLTQLVPGWGKVIPQFNIAESFVINPNNTVTYYNSGVGVMFLPSGLAFFSGSAQGVPVYTNVAFSFELYQYQENDHDEDNVPSFKEDIDGDKVLTNDDTDDDNLFDFIDVDDDGDGVLTRNEDLEPDTDLEDDRDGDGDPTNDIGDGDPTNDDTDGDGIPNYLDEDDNCSRRDYSGTNGIPDCIEN